MTPWIFKALLHHVEFKKIKSSWTIAQTNEYSFLQKENLSVLFQQQPWKQTIIHVKERFGVSIYHFATKQQGTASLFLSIENSYFLK